MLITAIGVSFFLENLFNVLFGGSSRFFSAPDFFNQTRAFGSVIITNVAWIVPLITVLLLLAILWLLYRTRYGMAIRAVAFDVNTVRLMGIDANRGDERDGRHGGPRLRHHVPRWHLGGVDHSIFFGVQHQFLRAAERLRTCQTGDGR